MRTLTLWAIAAVGAMNVGCSTDPIGPDFVETDGLEISVEAMPATIAPGAFTEITVEYRNNTSQELTLGFPMGCPFYLLVRDRRTNELIPMEGTVGVCLAVGSSITVPAMDTIVQVMPIQAEVDGRSVGNGRYVAQLDFTNGQWDLEVGFTVE
jgi:hypothetical protein